jgi:hypothetical protein
MCPVFTGPQCMGTRAEPTYTVYLHVAMLALAVQPDVPSAAVADKETLPLRIPAVLTRVRGGTDKSLAL